MSEIPDDIIQAGILEAEIYAKWLHAGNSKGSLSPHAIDGLADIFSRLIFSERQRHAEVMEEVRNVLGEVDSTLECYAEPSGYTDCFDEPYGPEESHPGLLAESTLKAVRALLSRLEER